MQRFHMLCKRDVSGVSGTGIVLDSVVMPSDKVVVEWRGDKSSVAIYDNLANFITIHGHEGSSQVV